MNSRWALRRGFDRLPIVVGDRVSIQFLLTNTDSDPTGRFVVNIKGLRPKDRGLLDLKEAELGSVEARYNPRKGNWTVDNIDPGQTQALLFSAQVEQPGEQEVTVSFPKVIVDYSSPINGVRKQQTETIMVGQREGSGMHQAITALQLLA